MILERILEEVLGLEADDPIVLAFRLNSITKITQLLLFTQDQFASLVYQEAADQSPARVLGPVQAATLFSVPTWFRAQPNPSLELWSTLTEDSLSDWVMTTAHVVPTSPTAAAPPTPTPSFSVEECKHTRSQVHAFQMQIKQTPGDFPTFKEDKGWFQLLA